MGIPKQFVNIIGIIVVFAIIAAGVALIALPLYLQSTSTATEAAAVSVGNDGYQGQVDGLREAEKDIDAITADVAALRVQIPVTNRLDDVFEIITQAAVLTGVTVDSATAGSVEPFVLRAATDPEAAAIPDPTGAAPASDELAEGTVDGDVPSDDVSPAPEAPIAAQRQVPFTITVTAPSPQAASAFLDTLGVGPRLMAIIQSSLEPANNGAFTLNVNALTFVHTES